MSISCDCCDEHYEYVMTVDEYKWAVDLLKEADRVIDILYTQGDFSKCGGMDGEGDAIIGHVVNGFRESMDKVVKDAH